MVRTCANKTTEESKEGRGGVGGSAENGTEKDEEGNVGQSEGTGFPGGLSTSYFMVSKFTLKKMIL